MLCVIFNTCIQHNIFPKQWKEAIVKAVPKIKQSLDFQQIITRFHYSTMLEKFLKESSEMEAFWKLSKAASVKPGIALATLTLQSAKKLFQKGNLENKHVIHTLSGANVHTHCIDP